MFSRLLDVTECVLEDPSSECVVVWVVWHASEQMKKHDDKLVEWRPPQQLQVDSVFHFELLILRDVLKDWYSHAL